MQNIAVILEILAQHVPTGVFVAVEEAFLLGSDRHLVSSRPMVLTPGKIVDIMHLLEEDEAILVINVARCTRSYGFEHPEDQPSEALVCTLSRQAITFPGCHSLDSPEAFLKIRFGNTLETFQQIADQGRQITTPSA